LDSLPVCKSDPSYIPGKDYIVPSCTPTTPNDNGNGNNGDNDDDNGDGDDGNDGDNGSNDENMNTALLALSGIAMVCVAIAGGVLVYNLSSPSKTK
jgi:hypothetical protein